MKHGWTLAVVGAGTMGRRIAFGGVSQGIPTRLYDVSASALDEAARAVGRLVEDGVARGVLPAGTVEAVPELLVVHDDLEACVQGADLVIEAVPETVDLKRRVFARISSALGPSTIVATNTSSIPGSRLAESSGEPARFINMNFGPPDDRKVEVMPHGGTSSATVTAALRFVRDLGLVPILVRKEILGYACNRVWRAVKKESLRLVADGHITPEDLDRGWMLDWGTDIGPCGLMDVVGLDVVRDIEMVYHEATGDPSDRPPEFLDAMIARGHLGVKAGRGFYSYPDPAYRRPGWLEKGSSLPTEGVDNPPA